MCSVGLFPADDDLSIVLIPKIAKDILLLIQELDIMDIADIEGQQFVFHIGVEKISLDGNVVIAGYGQKGRLYRMGWVVIIDDVNAPASVADKNIRVFDIDLTDGGDGFGRVAIDGCKYGSAGCIDGFIDYI